MADSFSVTTDRDGSRSFREHDDRWSRGGGGPSRYRGNYSNNRGRGFRGSRRNYSRGSSYSRRGNYSNSRGRGRDWDAPAPDPRTRLDDDGDEAMGETGDNNYKKRFNPYGRPNRRSRGNYRGQKNYNSSYSGGGGGSGGMDAMKRLGLPVDSKGYGDTQWFRVTIPWGGKADKDYVLKNINSNIDTPFVPTHYHNEDKNAVFYINDRHSADALKLLSGKINMPNGYKMTLIVKTCGPPKLPMNPEEIEKVKVCMSGRYDPATKALNLSSFHMDSAFKAENLYMALSRAFVMSNVVKIVQENIPEIESLDLSDNKLFGLDHLVPLVSKTPDLKSLNLSHNRMNYFEELRKISDWKLVTLTLDGNNFCDKFSDQPSYVSAVRKIFPKVLKLDGHDLPPPIIFDIEARTDLPKSKDSYFPNIETQTTIVKFLKDYLTLYDSDNRAGLAGAYHNDAVFSLSTAYNSAVQYRQASLTAYIEESRNLIKNNNKDTGRKKKLLKCGNLIVPQLCLLPKTSHDPNSFVVDVDFVSTSLMTFTVQGVFKEVDSKMDKPPIRAFSRTFATVPGGHSMLIVNDMLTITNASPDQIQSAFKNPAPTPSSSPVPQTSPQTNPFEGVGMTDVQQKMVVSFMGDSRMNAEWSAKCLAENSWDYQKAGQNFIELQKQGKIPPEAFNK